MTWQSTQAWSVTKVHILVDGQWIQAWNLAKAHMPSWLGQWEGRSSSFSQSAFQLAWLISFGGVSKINGTGDGFTA